MVEKKEKDLKEKNLLSLAEAFQKATNISFSLVATAVFFPLAGIVLDKWLSTKPLFIVIGIIVGFVMMFVRISKLEKSMRNKNG